MMYDKTITVVNRLKKADIVGATSDDWIKTIVNGCEIKRISVKNVSGSNVSLGSSIIVLIPFGKGYLNYFDWKNCTSNGFTMNTNDIIFFDMELEEIPTNSNITSLKNLYKPNSCDVRVVNIAEDNGLATVQIKIEGV